MLTVKLRLPAIIDAQHGGFATGWSPVSWGSIDELFVNLTMPWRFILVASMRLRVIPADDVEKSRYLTEIEMLQ